MKKNATGLLLLVVPWLAFFASARAAGATSLITLLLTMGVSSFGLMILIDRRGK